MAPRPPARLWPGLARGAVLAMGLWLTAIGTAGAQVATGAAYEDPTTRYPHGALGDPVEHAGLVVTLEDGRTLRATWGPPVVFEDTAPRLVDLDGDGAPEIVTVEAHEALGARLALWRVADDTLQPFAATPWIGRRFRWLAPVGVGAADLDGDGHMELAYVDRPHLARTLRVWRIAFAADGSFTLTEIASAPGLTNHRLGDPTIPGGIRDCGQGPEMITADATWSRVMATRLDRDGTLHTRTLGPWSRGALDRALDCP